MELHPHPWRETHPVYYLVTPIDNSDNRGGNSRNYQFDVDGVPFTVEAQGRRYEPLVVARYALKMLAVGAASGDEGATARARAVLPAFLSSGRNDAAWGPGPAPDSMRAARLSGFIQATVISALLRLTDGNPDPETAELLDRAFDRMTTPIERGGPLSTLRGAPFIEERAKSPPVHNLGCCIDRLFACYDLADTLGHIGAQEVGESIERGLERNISLFCAPLGWSRYCLNLFGTSPLSSLQYHRYFSARLEVLALRTAVASFSVTVDIWRRALHSTTRRLAVGVAKSAQVVWMRSLRRLPLTEG